jgi:hypothetical protein
LRNKPDKTDGGRLVGWDAIWVRRSCIISSDIAQVSRHSMPPSSMLNIQWKLYFFLYKVSKCVELKITSYIRDAIHSPFCEFEKQKAKDLLF